MELQDDKFEEVTISSVSKQGDGWAIERSDGWGFFVPGTSPIEPTAGMTARFYGNGLGHTVRGLSLDGISVFYRTEAEEKEHQEVSLYGADAADWLKRWDEGESVWSIEMGGLGPGYEQCIHITAAEILRHLLDKKYDGACWDDTDKWAIDRKAIEHFGYADKTIEALGLSGAQWGAAMSLATSLYMRGPRAVMTDPRVKDRHIQVRRSFPQVA